MSDRFFRPGYEHRPAVAMYVVADKVRLTPERVEKVRLESNDERLLVDEWLREPTFPAESLDPSRLARRDEDVPGRGGRRSTGNPVPPRRRCGDERRQRLEVALRTPVPSAGLEGYGR